MTIHIGRVYTRAGDRGTTRLAGGQERKKNDARLEAYGTVDELNAVIGVLAENMVAGGGVGLSPDVYVSLVGKLRRIQNELFDLGGELATLPEDRHEKQILVGDGDVDRLEREMDEANEYLEPLRSFILPGGGVVSALFHQARTVCRRAERRLISLHDVEAQRGEAIRYLNRLSDWFFVQGRRATVGGELLWKPGDRG